MRKATLASLSLLLSMLGPKVALSQTDPPPPPIPPPPPAQPPAPAAPAPAAPAAEPAPGPAPAEAPVAPAPQPGTPNPNGQTGAAADTSGVLDYDFGYSLDAEATPESPNASEASEDVDDAELEREFRAESLHVSNSLRASTGLLHLSEASSGAPGTFRISLLAGFFSGSDFLCHANAVCPSPTGPSSAADDAERIEARLGISATLFPFLEAFAGIHNSATSNSRSQPELLQVLGDMNLGVKAFTPKPPETTFTFGGEAELWLLNGTGGVGLDGGGTSFALRGLASADFNNRKKADDRVPIRAHLNLGYLFDNSGAVVQDIEDEPPPVGRGERITRIERFGLGINRVDSLQIGVGAEYIHEIVRPFLEWTIDVPVNRQGYVCNLTTSSAAGDLCLGEEAGLSTSPSRLTFGARLFPWSSRGLSFTAALDVGTGATSRFLEEVAPELPWNLYLGVGYAIDTVPPKPVVKRVEVEGRATKAPERYIVGRVLDAKTNEPIPQALIFYDGMEMTGMVSRNDGAFRTINLEPGNYQFKVTAEGYREGTCSVTLPKDGASATPVGSGLVSAPVVPAPAAPAVSPAPDTAAAKGEAVTANVECKLKALPKVGTIIGSLVDAETGARVAGAKVKITDKLGRELELSADTAGAFRFENVPPGSSKISVEAPGYLASVSEYELEPRQELKARIGLNKRPKKPNVVVTKRELKLKRQVHFQHDSAEVLPDSYAILQEIADVLKNHPEIKRIEIQGHTDNTGAAPYNLKLSQNRANAVLESLVRLGVEPERLSAKGYGQERPLLPNVSDANRARNRRVQIIILERD